MEAARPRAGGPAGAKKWNVASLSSLKGTGYPVERSDAEWRAILSEEEFRVLRSGGTEGYGKGQYCKLFPKTGHFRCRGCQFPLYSAAAKFKHRDAGWDAFKGCFYTGTRSHVGLRGSKKKAEACCNNCGSHLGHTFFKASAVDRSKTQERHWVNSISVEHVAEPAPETITKEDAVSMVFNNPGGFATSA